MWCLGPTDTVDIFFEYSLLADLFRATSVQVGQELGLVLRKGIGLALGLGFECPIQTDVP